MKEMGTSGDRQDDIESVILLLPDLSAVFDDHTILLSRLADRFGVRDTALNWFRFYLESRKIVNEERKHGVLRGTQRQFSENICSEEDLRSRIFGTFVVKFLACLPLLGFSNIYKMV